MGSNFLGTIDGFLYSVELTGKAVVTNTDLLDPIKYRNDRYLIDEIDPLTKPVQQTIKEAVQQRNIEIKKKGEITKSIELFNGKTTTISSAQGAVSIVDNEGKLIMPSGTFQTPIQYYDLPSEITKASRKEIIDLLDKLKITDKVNWGDFLTDNENIPNILLEWVDKSMFDNEHEKQKAKELVINNYSAIQILLRDNVLNQETKIKETANKITLQAGQLFVETPIVNKSLEIEKGILKSVANINVKIEGEGQLIVAAEAQLKMPLNSLVSGYRLQIHGGKLMIENEEEKKGTLVNASINQAILMSQSDPLNESESVCNRSYQLFEFTEIIGKFDHVTLPETALNCSWNLSQLYSQGHIFEENKGLDTTEVHNTGVDHFYAYPSPIEQGEDLRLGLYYGNQINDDARFIVYIFDMLGQLHVKKEAFQKGNLVNYQDSTYWYSEITVLSDEFHHMAVGGYSILLVLAGEVVHKTKLGVIPRKK